MPIGLTVDAGWPWWVITLIAGGVVVVSLVGIAVARRPGVRATGVVLLIEGAVVAGVAPFVMSDMSSNAATATLSSSMGTRSSDSVIHVIEHAPPPHMQTVGIVMTFANPVFNADDTKRVGRDQGFCVHITLARGWECVFTTFLPGGQITAEGPESDNEDVSYPAAITGGTGKFKSAHGWSTDTARNKAATEFDLVFHLTG